MNDQRFQEAVTKVLVEALKDLWKAVKALQHEIETKPSGGQIRWRRFYFTPDVYWPDKDNDTNYVQLGDTGKFLSDTQVIAKIIIARCQYNPKRILRALRRIQAATRWCQMRAEGLRRAREQLWKNHAKAVETIMAEAAMLELGGKDEGDEYRYWVFENSQSNAGRTLKDGPVWKHVWGSTT